VSSVSPWSIQRVAQGLLTVLNIRGGRTPDELEGKVRGILNLLQFYGLQQQQVLTAGSAAVAASANVPQATITLANWAMLYCAQAAELPQAGRTQSGLGVSIARPGQRACIYAPINLAPYAAGTITILSTAFHPSEPMILPPGTVIGVLGFSGPGGNGIYSITADLGNLG
jgi:hypothetical protein